tara:strand:- start:228 stop:569 length:342 start_codon:yes stop_codon:yes gene_type:complete
MGGHRVPEQGPEDDGYDERGYDESQRAEILETTRGGPKDGSLITDLDPDRVRAFEDEEDEDAIDMTQSDMTDEAEERRLTRADRDEDEAQADWDAGRTGESGRTDSESEAMKP